MPDSTRRTFVARAMSGVAVITGLHAIRLPRIAGAQVAQRPDPLDRELVRTFVSAAHSDLDKTRSMLAETPGLVNATWDWGGGDFETALGGASHTGHAEIAAFLLASGARMDIFCATMMGKVDVVRACLADNPAIVTVKGPHTISLLRHAEAGKHEAMIALVTAALKDGKL